MSYFQELFEVLHALNLECGFRHNTLDTIA